MVLNNKDITENFMIFLRMHEIETKDMWLQLGDTSIEDPFFQVGKMVARPEIRDRNPKLLVNINFNLFSEKIIHQREVYGWLDVLGDIGGVTEMMGIIVGFFLLPFSYHNFIIKASYNLFFAKTKDDTLFCKDKN